MQTPIADFVREYAEKENSRFHMPGHKGHSFLGCEMYDITEVAGADALYEADGIIAESERHATELFGTAGTFFSTEGSSQCIRAMLYLAINYRKNVGRPYVIAGRNAHKAFLYAAALLDFDIVWLWPEEMHSLCSCQISPEQLEEELRAHENPPAAVYLTSPDYLGGQLALGALSEVCHRYNTVLAVDNAHGAYLHFLEKKCHPMDAGADICCDSAHKTLPVLTGGAYLQISKNAPGFFLENAKQALALFGSTSPSYLILSSLDLCNAYLANDYKKKLAATIKEIEHVRQSLLHAGWEVEKTDPLKLTIHAPKGLTGEEIAEHLRNCNVECEYADTEYVVLMATPENTKEDYERLIHAFGENGRERADKVVFFPVRCRQKCSVRAAFFAAHERVFVQESEGRICGAPTVGCPPAIPIVVSGELIDENAVMLLEHYGIEYVDVLKSSNNLFDRTILK